jgi:hypothetical protein
MTQDPYGRPPGTGSVVRGEVVPDDEANEAPPMTHFQKVASALRGDRTDPAAPGQDPSDQSDLGASPPDAQAPDPNGTWPRASQATIPAAPAAPAAEDSADAGSSADAEDAEDSADSVDDEADHDATRPEEVMAVRSPDDGEAGDYWDDETGPEEASAAAPPDTLVADAAADDAAVQPGVVTEPTYLHSDPDAEDPTATQPDLHSTAAGRETSAGAPVQEGLRPGESESGLRDFSDLTYGSLLPDAAEFKTRWQEVQFRFVDNPQGSVTDAADVIAQVTAKLEAAIQERQRAIAERQRTLRDRWSEGKSTDTESLRETLLMYRAFLDQLTGPEMS